MYITEADQKDMRALIEKFYIESAAGKTIAAERTISKLFTGYIDTMITGIIFSPAHSFWRFAEPDDLIQEARAAIYLSIIRKQYISGKGTLFNFIYTVIVNTLKNFSTKSNRHFDRKSGTDITKLYNNGSLIYVQNMDGGMVIEDIIGMLLLYFEDKPKFQGLTLLLGRYIDISGSTRFIKKHFVQYAKGNNYSPAMVNTFFSYLKRFGAKKQIKELLVLCETDKSIKGDRI